MAIAAALSREAIVLLTVAAPADAAVQIELQTASGGVIISGALSEPTRLASARSTAWASAARLPASRSSAAARHRRGAMRRRTTCSSAGSRTLTTASRRTRVRISATLQFSF